MGILISYRLIPYITGQICAVQSPIYNKPGSTGHCSLVSLATQISCFQGSIDPLINLSPSSVAPSVFWVKLVGVKNGGPEIGERNKNNRQSVTLPETNIFAPENGWLEYDCFLLGWPI